MTARNLVAGLERKRAWVGEVLRDEEKAQHRLKDNESRSDVGTVVGSRNKEQGLGALRRSVTS